MDIIYSFDNVGGCLLKRGRASRYLQGEDADALYELIYGEEVCPSDEGIQSELENYFE